MNMKKNTFFSGTAAVEIQGPRVLEFISIDEKQTEFDVIGLSNPKIHVIDARPSVLSTMHTILETAKWKR